MPRQEDLAKELTLWRRRLQKRKKQKALLGISADPSIDLEIEDIEATIKQLQADLTSEKPPPRQPSRATSPTKISFSRPPAPPDPQLTALRAKPRIFLCHASEDKAQVKQLYHQLKDAGYRPWLDKFDLLPGKKWRPAIKEIITDPDNLILVCLSNNSITKQGVIQQEIKWALDIMAEMPEEGIYLIPVRLEVCPAPEQLAELHWVDLFETDGFDYLSRALDYELRQRSAESPSEPASSAKSHPTPQPRPRPAPTKLPHVLSPQQPFEPELILIPAGEFLMGSDPKKDKFASINEQPQHLLYLPNYYIAKTPVTNAHYAVFVELSDHRQPGHWRNGKIPKGKEKHPVVNVSWGDTLAYCQWLVEITGKPYRLPTEAEWEKAARGSDGPIYPWGDWWDSKQCNIRDGGPGGTTPVDAYLKGASPYGVLDMSGNVWEWCATQRGKPYPYDAEEDEWTAAYLEKTGGRVLRGGSWRTSVRRARCAFRYVDLPVYVYSDWGYRVVVSPI